MGVLWTTALAAILASFGCVGCGAPAVSRAPASHPPTAQNPTLAEDPHAGRNRQSAAGPRTATEDAGLVLGRFALASKPVIDGDTIRVVGIDQSLRLLAIDTEETFKHKADLRAASANFQEYLAHKRGDSPRPPKVATPMGEEAKKFARDFFKGVKEVRLERDHPKEIRGSYGRYLVYVFAQKDGRWVNYNVECVRAGMSPYFTKYSYSRRFHDEFVAAERDAREHKRGIWSSETESFGDYPQRQAWWTARADFIKAFEAEPDTRGEHVILTHWDAPQRLRENLGKQVIILATVGEVRHFKGNVTRVALSRRQHESFPVIFFDPEVFERSGIATRDGEFVAVRGKVSEYAKGGKRELQIVVRYPDQVVLSPVSWPVEADAGAESK